MALPLVIEYHPAMHLQGAKFCQQALGVCGGAGIAGCLAGLLVTLYTSEMVTVCVAVTI